MKIRHKLMILLLAIAILPAVLTSVLHRSYMLKTGDELAGQTRQMLIHNATHHLRTAVTDFGRLADQYATAAGVARWLATTSESSDQADLGPASRGTMRYVPCASRITQPER